MPSNRFWSCLVGVFIGLPTAGFLWLGANAAAGGMFYLPPWVFFVLWLSIAGVAFLFPSAFAGFFGGLWRQIIKWWSL